MSRHMHAFPFHGDTWLRRLEGMTVRLEAPLYRWVRDPWLFLFYHTGTLAFGTLVLLGVTGLYVTLFYRFGFEGSYASIVGLDANLVGRVMRSAHRYLGDLFLVFTLLHAWRMFVQNRFKGARWLGWVAGVGMLAVTWAIGVTGFWMLADQRAQWLHGGLQHLLQRTLWGQRWVVDFLLPSPENNGWLYMVLLFFLHVGLTGLLGLLYWWHIRHLQRPRWLPPRPWWAWVTVGVLLLALFWPVPHLPMWDFTRWPETVPLNVFYLSLLPDLLRRGWGTAVLALLLLGVALFPWVWWPARRPRPVRLKVDACIGCTLCAQDCPYGALEMVPREGPGPQWVARLHPERCVGCGVCVGSCPTDALALEEGAGDPETLRARIRTAAQPAQGQAPRVVLACARHRAHNPAWGTSDVPEGTRDVPTRVVEVSCVAAVHPDVLALAWEQGAGQVEVVGCPPEDCPARYGNRWEEARLRRERKPWLRARWRAFPLRWRWTPPSEFRRMATDGNRFPGEETALPEHRQEAGRSWWRRPGSRRALTLWAALLLLVGLGNRWPYTGPAWGQQATLDLVVTHTLGQPLEKAQPLASDPSRAPGLYLWLDGTLSGFWPTAVPASGRITLFRRIFLEPGWHRVRVEWVVEDARGGREAWRLLQVEQTWTPRRIYLFHFRDERQDGDPERGRRLFFEQLPGENTGCRLCHSLEPGVTLVGPSLAGIADRAAYRIPGMKAVEYLYQSIVDPDAYVVPGYPAGVMPPNYREFLSEEEIQDLVAFLLTLHASEATPTPNP